MSKNTSGTLGEKLRPATGAKPNKILRHITVLSIIGLMSWVQYSNGFIGASQIAMYAGGAFVAYVLYSALTSQSGRAKQHFLFRHDTQGFMKSLKLSDKTAVFDGNNIYHFGMDKGAGRMVLQTLVRQLRSEGYRIVCFFDANIFFTLRESGEFLHMGSRFSLGMLKRIFDLNPYEIYIVPSGNQADLFIVESLSHLPFSFAVTNDQFRDYKSKYGFLAKDSDWRKGVRIKDRTIYLHQHSFKKPLTL